MKNSRFILLVGLSASILSSCEKECVKPEQALQSEPPIELGPTERFYPEFTQYERVATGTYLFWGNCGRDYMDRSFHARLKEGFFMGDQYIYRMESWRTESFDAPGTGDSLAESGFYRYDHANKKAWFIADTSTMEATLLFDFNSIEVGQTLMLDNDSHLEVLVTEVGTITMGSLVLPQVKVQVVDAPVDTQRPPVYEGEIVITPFTPNPAFLMRPFSDLDFPEFVDRISSNPAVSGNYYYGCKFEARNVLTNTPFYWQRSVGGIY